MSFNICGSNLLSSSFLKEPPAAAASDKEKISGIHLSRKASFERAWEDHKYRLEQHNQLCIFNRDMHLVCIGKIFLQIKLKKNIC